MSIVHQIYEELLLLVKSLQKRRGTELKLLFQAPSWGLSRKAKKDLEKADKKIQGKLIYMISNIRILIMCDLTIYFVLIYIKTIYRN